MKLERLLAIVMLLVNRRRVQAQELAEKFEVSVRTIYRDIDAINLAGLPVVTYQGAGGGVGIAESYRIDKNFLTSDELASVIIALKGATSYNDRRAASTLEKIRGMIPESQAAALRAKTQHTVVDLSPWGGDPGLQQKLAALKAAILDCRPITFGYWSTRGETTDRDVEPYVLVLKGQNWYLYGYCRLRRAFRLFKVARMKKIAPGAGSFERQAIDIDAAPWESEWHKSATMVQLLLRFDPMVRGLVEEQFDDVTVDADGRLLVRTAFPEDGWVYGFILSFGPSVEVLEPPHVRETMRRMAEGIAQLYRPVL
ncbi:MAG TPA: YafY family protein [Symbiobacteriaceae bacterium]|nr:YafY family protein [Symbiobacteriaceae bacterium]